MTGYTFASPSGLLISRTDRDIDFKRGIEFVAEALDRKRGAYLSSGVEDQALYTRWDFGFVDPPLELVARGRRLWVRALNERGTSILAMAKPILLEDPAVVLETSEARELVLAVAESEGVFAEEERSRRPSVFTPIRSLLRELVGFEDGFLGLYGAFGYDLIFQFDPLPLRMPRGAADKVLHLYLPDRILVVDRRLEVARSYEYEFEKRGMSTVGCSEEAFAPLPRADSGRISVGSAIASDHTPEAYMAKVGAARERMHAGDIFEVVLSRDYTVDYGGPPSALYRLMSRINPSPYEFFLQFGEEQLVGASPEMFVRVDGRRVESAPISGTIRRGANPMENAERVKALFNSEKDEVELTMCTDVDRNDKARICEPGSVKLLARRSIERYAGLFHTVDHVEGRLREGFDGLDAFLSHMWAVTLTGAPKRKAVAIIEEVEVSPRRWYGGAVGAVMFDGSVKTGITIRTAHLEGGRAHYRTGATLVYDSVPAEEEKETELKATAFFRAFATLTAPTASAPPVAPEAPYAGVRIVMIDNEDSFVHTLADYLRQTGAEVSTFRRGAAVLAAIEERPDLIVHSPGPGRPRDHGVPALVTEVAGRAIPQFGVCLGLQGIVEAFGGEIGTLPIPRHGKYWMLYHDGAALFADVPNPCRVGAYHSLFAVRDRLPEDLVVAAENEDGLVMAVHHRELPIAAVQFHPESILSLDGDVGRLIIRNALASLLPGRAAQAA